MLVVFEVPKGHLVAEKYSSRLKRGGRALLWLVS